MRKKRQTKQWTRINFLSIQFKNCQEEIRTLKGERERLQADMKQIIRYSQTDKLTQGLVDTFIFDLFFIWRLVTLVMLGSWRDLSSNAYNGLRK